jgi:mannose-6-phosphate isomerase
VPLYPLKFKPRLLEKMWAGRKIQTVLGKPIPDGKSIGESWELYDFPPGSLDSPTDWISAQVSNGPLASRTLHELVIEFGADLYGDVPLVAPHGQFPILIKFLDAQQDLSIQVHPDSAYAAAHPGAFLKSEAWFIVQNDPGARLFIGLKPGTTPAQFKDSIAKGHCERLLNEVPVKPGQVFYLPSGTVHAVGAGILAAEVQTPSDTTFRVYDFNRVDPTTGKTRTLHVDQALACMHFAQQPGRPTPTPATGPLHEPESRLVSCEYFNLQQVRLRARTDDAIDIGRPIVWIMLEGRAEITVDDLPEPVPFTRGDTVLLPAAMNRPRLKTLTDCLWLEVTFPQ